MARVLRDTAAMPPTFGGFERDMNNELNSRATRPPFSMPSWLRNRIVLIPMTDEWHDDNSILPQNTTTAVSEMPPQPAAGSVVDLASLNPWQPLPPMEGDVD